MAEPEEDSQTPEERLAWLRARGVTVEMPGEVSGPEVSGDGRTFVFVKIPVDDSEDIEERSGPACVGDALPALLSKEFAGCGLSDDELRAHAAGQTVDIKVLRLIMEKGSCEHFRLAVPTAENGREAVCAYIDESSSWKGLPRNARASALASQCGFPGSCEFYGDVFVGRQKWSGEGLVHNIDLKVAELDPSSLWIRRAVPENLEFQKATQREEHEKAQATLSDAPASGEGEGYTWKDEGEELEVIVQVPAGTAKKDVKVEFKRQEVKFSKPVALSLKLFKQVEVDGCNWSMGKDGQVVLTLEKGAAAPWPQLLAA
mmetsp:Transcript_66268/g.194361  ORF Transcript_66268/g.194361 Transcript_66268/m.194361 type:complete len:316 (+) Transcript_66268:96-1043(+)